MPIGYDYYCQQCRYEWMLFSKRFSLGPVQWGALNYTCLTCQTFLSIAAIVDANSWSVWLRGHKSEVDQNPTTSQLADIIEQRLARVSRLKPVKLDFESIECPTCHEIMSKEPFGTLSMKCPQCGNFAGEFVNNEGITIYRIIADDETE